MNRALAISAASTLALGGLVVAAPAASADDGDVKMRAACGAPSSSVWAVKVKPKKGGLRTDFRVKTDAVGQEWSFTLTRAGALIAAASKSTIADDDSLSGTRIALRDHHDDDDSSHDVDDDDSLHDEDDDSVTEADDLDDDGSLHDVDDDSVTGADDSDDDGPLHDVDDDSVTGVDDSASSSSSPARSSSRVAEAKFRTWIPDVAGDLVFTATFKDETCTVTVPRP